MICRPGVVKPMDARTRAAGHYHRAGSGVSGRGARPAPMIIGMDRTPKGEFCAAGPARPTNRDVYFPSPRATTTAAPGPCASGRRAPDPSGKRSGVAVGICDDPLGRCWLFFRTDRHREPVPRRLVHPLTTTPMQTSPIWSRAVSVCEGARSTNPRCSTAATGCFRCPIGGRTAWDFVLRPNRADL
jgi:hypothetical protein